MTAQQIAQEIMQVYGALFSVMVACNALMGIGAIKLFRMKRSK